MYSHATRRARGGRRRDLQELARVAASSHKPPPFLPSSTPPAPMGGDSIRGGTRGGRDQFNWEDVKADKHREFYLGASVKASVGRWQKDRDVLWYTRDGADGAQARAATATSARSRRVVPYWCMCRDAAKA